jgi:hypothetical protein
MASFAWCYITSYDPTKIGKWKLVNVLAAQPPLPALPFKQYYALASPVPGAADIYEFRRRSQRAYGELSGRIIATAAVLLGVAQRYSLASLLLSTRARR